MSRTDAIKKTLSKNDTGETGGHQAGMLIPKNPDILSFFPKLNTLEKNPRVMLTFTDEIGIKWSFSFIYYNNKLFGGTRNEYRLTGMTKFLKANSLKVGDEILLRRDQDDLYRIGIHKENSRNPYSSSRIVLGNKWIAIKI